LSGDPTVGAFSRRPLPRLARGVTRQEDPPGGRIIAEGEKGDGRYLFEKGSVKVTVRGEQNATLGPGDYVGEMAVIDEGPRSATVTAESAVSALMLPPSALVRMIQRDPSVTQALANELRERISEAGAQAPEAP